MSDEIQACPHECGARFARTVLERATEWRCPECNGPVAPCPVCDTFVDIGAVYHDNQCPECHRPRLDLGQAWRDKEAVAEVSPDD